MLKNILLLFCLFLFQFSFAQDSGSDWNWWNTLHGWEYGDPGWRNWIKIAPGYMGPNALPVPEVKKGLIGCETEFEITASNHFHTGDPTQDISGRIFIPFSNNKIAIEMYGIGFEHFAFSEAIRNERIARDYDGKGNAVGDFYFSTLIQLCRDRKFPNTLLRVATKTASGNQLEAARFTDSPGYFFDVSLSKQTGSIIKGLWRPFGLFGFYTWQTNDEMNLQNDAYMYAGGIDFEKNAWLISGSFSGYSGYKNQRDRPVQLNFEVFRNFGKYALRFRYLHGLRDWEYKTVKFSFIKKLYVK